jgi:outer membrane receptor protein involved in Fe transport
VYGPHYSRLANPLLGPEYQQGGEGGLELYLGGRASLVVTRYNQTVNGLIAEIPGVDSVRSLTPNPIFFGFLTSANCMAQGWGPTLCSSRDAAGYVYALLTQNINAASIRNQGWELQGSLATGPLTTRGTYSWTKSRSLGVTPHFRESFASQLVYFPEYRQGAMFSYLPEHTWAVGVTYARAQTTVGLNLTGIGQFRNGVDEFALEHFDGSIRLPQNRLNFDPYLFRNYTSLSRGYTMADITATHRFSQRMESVLEIQNLTDHYTQDAGATFATLGRQIKMGLRIRL